MIRKIGLALLREFPAAYLLGISLILLSLIFSVADSKVLFGAPEFLIYFFAGTLLTSSLIDHVVTTIFCLRILTTQFPFQQ